MIDLNIQNLFFYTYSDFLTAAVFTVYQITVLNLRYIYFHRVPSILLGRTHCEGPKVDGRFHVIGFPPPPPPPQKKKKNKNKKTTTTTTKKNKKKKNKQTKNFSQLGDSVEQVNFYRGILLPSGAHQRQGFMLWAAGYKRQITAWLLVCVYDPNVHVLPAWCLA